MVEFAHIPFCFLFSHRHSLNMGNRKSASYPGFDYHIELLSAYALCIDIFVISLKNGNIIRHSPYDVQGFNDWLCKHSVRDINSDDGYSHRVFKAQMAN